MDCAMVESAPKAFLALVLDKRGDVHQQGTTQLAGKARGANILVTLDVVPMGDNVVGGRAGQEQGLRAKKAFRFHEGATPTDVGPRPRKPGIVERGKG